MLFFLSPQNFASALSSASLWAILTPRETEDNAYAKFWGDKQRELWYVMVILEWSIVMTCYDL